MLKNLKKVICYVSAIALFAVGAGILTACGADPTELTSDMVKLEYTSVAYTGADLTPAVTVVVAEQTVDATHYDVEYSNNKNVGTASVKITAKEDDKSISGSVTLNFEITKGTASVANFSELESAIANENYGTVKLTADIDTDSHVVITRTVTLDLNGKTLKGDGEDGVIEVKAGGNVTITGNGSIVAKESLGGYAMAVWAHGVEGTANVIIENGSFSQQMTTAEDDWDDKYDMIYASRTANITILGGRFESVIPQWTLNIKNADAQAGTAKIEVKGGTFIGFNPANVNTDNTGTSITADNYVATGFTARQIESTGNYEVVADAE